MMLYPGGPSIIQPCRDALRFTRNADDGDSPLITAAGAADKDFVWRGPLGSFVGKQPDIANFPAGDFSLDSRAWALITQLNFTDRKLTGLDIERLLIRLTALTHLYANTNAGLVGDLSGWSLPASLVTLYLGGTSVSGDVSGWVLPASLTTLYLYNTSVSGDVSGWVLPASLANLSLGGISVSGDVSGWVLPAGLVNLYLHNTSVSGDVSGWVLPAGLVNLCLHNTSADYGTDGMMATATRDASTYRFDDCTMTQAEVDRILADANTSGTINSILNVAGSNAAPTGGAGNADYLALIAAGWTVTIS